MHARQQIRAAFVTALTGATAAGSMVFKTRIYKLQEDEYPALVVYTLSEDVEVDALGGKQLRTLRVAVDIAVKGASDTLDDDLDDLAVEVEEAIEGNAALNALVLFQTLDATAITLSGEGNERAVGMVLSFVVQYRTNPGAPETITN